MTSRICDGSFLGRLKRDDLICVFVNKPLILRCCLFFLLTIIWSAPTYAKYGGGTGSQAEPYLIFTPEHLSQIGLTPDDWDKYFKLMADLDMKDYNDQPGHQKFESIGYLNWEHYSSKPFKGVFDGNKKKILNLSISEKDKNFAGLFGFVAGSNACIKDLTLVNPKIIAENAMCVGAMAGRLKKSTITNCVIENADIYGGDSVGGLTGYNADGIIQNCRISGIVTGNINIGGVAGYNCGRELSYCTFSGEVRGLDDVGGIAGESDSEIKYCSANTSIYAAGDKAGGLIGTLRGTVKSCYSKGNVIGNNEVGGLIGRNAGFVQDCYSHCYVAGNSYSGGLTGLLYSNGTVSKSYTVCEIDSDSSESGWFIGYGSRNMVHDSFWPENQNELNNMKKLDTYISAGWDFIGESRNGNLDLWDICEGGGFPRLVWQARLPGDFDCPEGVDLGDISLLAERWLEKTTSLDLTGRIGDNIVDFRDFTVIALSWRSQAGQSLYDALYDLYPDGSIDAFDLFVLSKHWLAAGLNKADVFEVKGDGLVDFEDWVIFADAWRSCPGNPNWNKKCDVYPKGGDGVIDYEDLAEFAEQWMMPSYADIAPAGQRDGIVNLLDLALALQNYIVIE